MNLPQPAPAVVVAGVHPGQSPAVAREAATLAAALGLELVCAYANPGRYVVAEAEDGTVTSASVDPDFDGTDLDDAGEAVFPPRLATFLGTVLEPLGVRWRPLLLAGDAADALARCAGTLNAALIVVGTHEDTHGGSMREFFRHSVATNLTRKQRRPVVVVPVHPGPAGTGRP
ncbi:universal stress protein [Specibacter sp. RAF43]|uniref:universal stress protein n=1 Tax=Specibacter sp. RAF43 TaxID=3233057 RepID=UPI003F948418